MIYKGKFGRMELYRNTRGLTDEQIKAETGCDTILNGVLFNADGSLCCDNKSKGNVLSDDQYGYWGIGWNDGEFPKRDSSVNMAQYKNFISCVPVANNYRRGRTALGFKGKDYKVLCVQDGFGAISIDDVDNSMSDCDFFTYLDGGGSSCCITPKGKVNSSYTRESRNQTYILIWEKKEDKPMNTLRKYKVALDPGHGLKELNQSPDGRYFEYKFAWDMANIIKKLLEATARIEVLIVKESEGETPSLSSRAQIANDWGADVYISLHSNAVGAGQWVDGTHGLTVWTYAAGGKRDVLAHLVLEEMAERGVELFGSQLYHSKFTVLAKSTMPAILIEHLFHTCHSDVDKLLNKDYRDKLAPATCAAVLRYFELDESLLVEDEDTLKEENEVLKDIIYRVQVGAFSDENNAEHMLELIKKQGLDGFVVPVKK